jgi:phospholipid-binding lipoprotein MlaA
MGFDPLFWYGINGDHEAIGHIRTAATILDAKDRSRDAVNDLRNNSLDFYAAIRSVVYQRRQALILDQDMASDEGRANAASTIDIPDYDDEDY